MSNLMPDVKNANKGTDRGRELLKHSLKELGAGRSILADKHGNIIAGNKTYEGIRELGIRVREVESDGSELIVVKRTDLDLYDGTKARELAYADNRVSEIDLQWEAEQVAADLESGIDLNALGFGEKDLRDILDELYPNVKLVQKIKIDNAKELQNKWNVQRGQIWKFGDMGTLYCGDAASARIKCDFCFIDPPYEWSTQQQENAMMWADWKNLILMGLKNCFPLALRSDCNHWWIWDSGMARFGGKGYKPMSGCAMVLNFGDKRRWYEEQSILVLDKFEVEHFEYPTQYLHIQDHLFGMDRERDEKPQALVQYIISLYSGDGEIVGDLFAGSGAIMQACIDLKRQYRGSEIVPKNCAVILEKYYLLTGIVPIIQQFEQVQ